MDAWSELGGAMSIDKSMNLIEFRFRVPHEFFESGPVLIDLVPCRCDVDFLGHIVWEILGYLLEFR